VKRRLRVGGVIALALILGVPGVAGAAMPASAATTRDAASTKAFIALQERNDIGAIRAATAVNAAETAVVAQAHSECSNVLKGVPSKANAHQFAPITQFFPEALYALNIRQLTPLRGLSERVGHQQQRLRFSDPALQWQVNVGGSALLAYVDLQPPDLCTDARVLATSHFTKVTAAGTRFARAASTLFPLASAAPSQLLRQMRPYAPNAVSVALKRLPELQRTLDHKLAFDRHYRALLRALGERHTEVADGTSALAGMAS
jgi:hypothetical protein